VFDRVASATAADGFPAKIAVLRQVFPKKAAKIAVLRQVFPKKAKQ
jgi:hypothetical protein